MEIQRKEVRSTEVGALAAPHPPWHGYPPGRWQHRVPTGAGLDYWGSGINLRVIVELNSANVACANLDDQRYHILYWLICLGSAC